MAQAISRDKNWPKTGLDHMRWHFGQMLSSVKAARLRRVRYRTTFSELIALSDRELADLGIPRANIRRISLEDARKDKTYETA